MHSTYCIIYFIINILIYITLISLIIVTIVTKEVGADQLTSPSTSLHETVYSLVLYSSVVNGLTILHIIYCEIFKIFYTCILYPSNATFLILLSMICTSNVIIFSMTIGLGPPNLPPLDTLGPFCFLIPLFKC